MTLLEKALGIALEAHKGQKDKAGEPYILHPIRVMMAVQTEEEKIVALLHDVIEDSSATIEDLRKHGFDDRILDAVQSLTRNPSLVSYEDTIERIKKTPIAANVKLADLEDNMNIKRIKKVTDKDLKRIKKYHNAWSVLNKL